MGGTNQRMKIIEEMKISHVIKPSVNMPVSAFKFGKRQIETWQDMLFGNGLGSKKTIFKTLMPGRSVEGIRQRTSVGFAKNAYPDQFDLITFLE